MNEIRARLSEIRAKVSEIRTDIIIYTNDDNQPANMYFWQARLASCSYLAENNNPITGSSSNHDPSKSRSRPDDTTVMFSMVAKW